VVDGRVAEGMTLRVGVPHRHHAAPGESSTPSPG
jgi:hypothetical protein